MPSRGESAALSLFAEDIVLMRAVGMRPVVVHGGGPQISDLMSRLGKVPEFRDGLRVTDAETVDIARMVLVGKVNPGIVSAINVHGALAVGVSGESAGLIEASQQDPALGFVGEVARVNPAILERLLAQDLIPVIATIGSGADGQAYNINADVVAGAVAEALGAEKLVYLTDIEGIRRDANDPATLIRQITATELDALIADGVADRRDDPEGRLVRARGAPRRRSRAHPRRTHPPRPAARDVHRRRDRHDGPPGGPAMSSPLMPTYAPPRVMFVRGEGSLPLGRRAASDTSTSSPGSR